MFNSDVDLDRVENIVLNRGMNFSGNADDIKYKKEIYAIAVKATIHVLKEYSRQSGD